MYRTIMLANWMKQVHEEKNGFTYDMVVRTRTDMGFAPGSKFKIHEMPLNTSYSWMLGRATFELHFMEFSEVFFYSSSPTMDVIADIYRWYSSNGNGTEDELTFSLLGPGTTMYRYMTHYNIHPVLRPFHIPAVIVRKNAAHLDIVSDWAAIEQAHRDYYNT